MEQGHRHEFFVISTFIKLLKNLQRQQSKNYPAQNLGCTLCWCTLLLGYGSGSYIYIELNSVLTTFTNGHSRIRARELQQRLALYNFNWRGYWIKVFYDCSIHRSVSIITKRVCAAFPNGSTCKLINEATNSYLRWERY